jgi:hypothetical protein
MGVNKSHAKEYYAWIDMRRRCNDPCRPQYSRYGGRGIRVCARWENSFADFIADVGMAPDKTSVLDRIDNDGDYDPSNVTWSTPKRSTNNRGVTRHVVVGGDRVPVEVAAPLLGCTGSALRDRLRRGWSEEEAGIKPKKQPRYYSIAGQRMTPTQWAKVRGIPPATVNTRLRRGLTIEEALTLTPRIMRGA